jgi:uncharacterized protein (TIGR00251 family)
VTPPYLKETPEGVRLSVKLQPRSSRNKIGGVIGNELKIHVTAPPVDSAANQALMEFVADALDIPARSVQLIKGRASRSKTLLIIGPGKERIEKALNQISAE